MLNRDLGSSLPECLTSQSSPKAVIESIVTERNGLLSSPASASMPFRCISPYRSLPSTESLPSLPLILHLKHCKALVSLLKPSRILHSAPAVREKKYTNNSKKTMPSKLRVEKSSSRHASRRGREVAVNSIGLKVSLGAPGGREADCITSSSLLLLSLVISVMFNLLLFV